MKQISFNGQIYTSESNDSVLDAVSRKEQVIYSECRSGFCGACKCKVKKGTVKPIRDTIAFIPEGYVLACSVRAITDIEIEL